jgi:membrane protease YdiL (CAAX protease family)
MKKRITILTPLFLFSLLVVLLRLADIPRNIFALILTLSLPIALLGVYLLHKKGNFRCAMLGLSLSLATASSAIFVLYKIRGGAVFGVDLGWYSVLSTVSLALLAATLEEFAFRGIILSLLLRYFTKFPVALSVAIQALAFSLYHPNRSTASFVLLTFSGLFLGWVAYRTKSLWFSLGFHFGWDFLIITTTGFHSVNLGHIKSVIVFDSDYVDINNYIFLASLGLAALLTFWAMRRVSAAHFSRFVMGKRQ